jgi:arylsulfatase
MSFWRWPGRFEPHDVAALTAHIDFFPTIAEIAGAPLDEKTRQQIEGRSLTPLLARADAPWPERTLVTHVGRWPRFSDPDTAKFTNCSVRTPRWHLVSIRGGNEPAWQLFDVAADPGERNDVAPQHADVIARLAADYDAWWKSVRPALVNEKAIGPKLNPFKEAYWKQFGGGPTEEDFRIMEPTQREVPREGKKK